MTRHSRQVATFGSALLLVGASACSDDLPTVSQRVEPVSTRVTDASARGGRWKTPDEQFVEMNKELPGFGGLFFDSTGTPHVFLKDFGRREHARAVVADYLAANGDRRGVAMVPRLVVHEGQYDFAQLSAWQYTLEHEATLSNVVLTGVDDLTNRVTIGVTEQAAADPIRAQFAGLGIPEEAVVFEVMGRPVLQATLRDLYHPRIAGLQISRTLDSTFACTLGFFALPNRDSSRAHFVTNSHCTDAMWTVTSHAIGQPDMNHPIGYEVGDPPLFDNAADPLCPATSPLSGLPVKCRRSDAALFMATYSVNPFWHGTIAGTLGSSINITDSWSITNTGTIVGVGSRVRKVGRTTGTTVGTVRRMCDNVWHSSQGLTDVWLLCQAAADFVAGGGDSGAPVYADDLWTGSGHYNPVMLQGIVWGRAIQSCCPTRYKPYEYYSLFPHINSELSPIAGGYLHAAR